jgi:hypothetical protein
MQICDVTVRLAGSVQHTVPKTGVTPGEIVLLKHIHGGDSVVDIRPTGKIKRSDHAEWDRLAASYDQAAAMPAPGETRVPLMERLFGASAIRKLPKTLKEIGLDGIVLAGSSEPTPVPEGEGEEGGEDGGDEA